MKNLMRFFRGITVQSFILMCMIFSILSIVGLMIFFPPKSEEKIRISTENGNLIILSSNDTIRKLTETKKQRAECYDACLKVCKIKWSK